MAAIHDLIGLTGDERLRDRPAVVQKLLLIGKPAQFDAFFDGVS